MVVEICRYKKCCKSNGFIDLPLQGPKCIRVGFLEKRQCSFEKLGVEGSERRAGGRQSCIRVRKQTRQVSKAAW